MVVSLFKWIWRGWPVLVILLIIITHQLSSQLQCIPNFSCWSNQQVDHFMSFALNLTGGCFVLYSIDSNLGVFRKGGIATLFKKWVKSCPLIKGEPLVIKAKSINSTSTVFGGEVTLNETPKSVEDLYKYTQAQFASIKGNIKEQRRHTDEKISLLSSKVSADNADSNKKISAINQQLQTVAVGGFKLQLLGVMLVVYGSYLSFSA